MKSESSWPLTPALILLLQACVDVRSTQDKKLAQHLCLSPETIRTEFKRIAESLGTHDRFEAVLLAWEKNWIRLPPP